MSPTWKRWWRGSALALDAIVVLLALGAAAALRAGPLRALDGVSSGAIEGAVTPWLAAVPLWIVAFAVFGLYGQMLSLAEEVRRLASAAFAAPLLLVLTMLFADVDPSRIWIVSGSVFAFVGAVIGRRGLRWTVSRLRRRGRWLTRTIVVGGRGANCVVDHLARDTTAGYLPVGTCGFVWGRAPSATIGELEELALSERAEAIIVVTEDLDRTETRRAIAAADRLLTSVVVLPGLEYALAHNVRVVPVWQEPGLALHAPSLRPLQRTMKRTLDVAVASTALLLFSPVLALIALAIRIDSKGPVLFGQRRLGLGGRPFRILKFRTMVAGAEELHSTLASSNGSAGVLFKLSDDPRFTRLGRVLRRLSIDELPQLWNVLVGEMSLVGPRPIFADDYGLEGEEAALLRRLQVRPGMTGLWQVRGRGSLDSHELIRLDLMYIQNWSVLLDLYLMLGTIPAVLSRRGAR
jgi:exopolysaccharide biosynthesis polyprenyl glycosylphosphotransferase